MRQKGSVDEYIQEFEVLVAYASGVTEEQLRDISSLGCRRGFEIL